MSFRDARSKIIQALQTGDFSHEARSAQQVKNLLVNDELSAAEAIQIISATIGHQAEHSPHHYLPSVHVWIFKPVCAGQRWYIKFYEVDDHLILVSFHPQEVP